MSVIQTCHDTKDTLDLFRPQDLYLKPIARLNISVQLPQLKKSGAKISNWEVMERVKDMARPLTFPVFKVAKSSLEFIRFEAEIDNFGSMDTALAKLDMKTIKLSGFEELLKVRAAEAKPPFPTRHDWDSFFRDNKNMNEMKPGERPDTIHLQNLPTKWFVNHQDRSGVAKDKPSEYVLKKVFQTFGEIRSFDIPSLDPYRDQMKSSISGIQTFTFGQDMVFEAYVQFKEYIGFVKAMNSLKGMKLLNKDRFESRSWVANIKVDFDKTKHLSESSIKKRGQEREKLIEKEREKEEAERRRKELERMKREDELRRMKEDEREAILKKEAIRQEKIRRRMEREERRRQRKLQKRNMTDEEEMNRRIAVEERKLLVAQRKLESIRMLDELLERVKVVRNENKNVKNLEKDLLKAAKAATKVGRGGDLSSMVSGGDKDEKVLRDKLVSKLKQKEMDRVKLHGDKLRDARDRNLYTSSEDSMEDISDGDLDAGGDNFDQISDEDLRLTSTDDDQKSDPKAAEVSEEETKSKKSKKKKKEKKRKKDKKEKKKRRKELESQITLAQRIANRDRRERSRSPRDDGRRRKSDRESKEKDPYFMRRRDAYEEQMEMQKAILHEKKMKARLEARQREQAKEEVYDKMINPHLYGGSDLSGSGGGYRKLKKGEHYEEVQKEALENEIRIRERRERYQRERQRDERYEYRERFHREGEYDRRVRPHSHHERPAPRPHLNPHYRPRQRHEEVEDYRYHHDDRDRRRR